MTPRPLRHLLISREYPPAAYPAGGIGTYAENIATLLASAGETVHVIGERWSGAPLARETRHQGRLVIHRVPLDQPLRAGARSSTAEELQVLGDSSFPVQRFAWQAALLAETLIEAEAIDVVEGQEWEAPLYYFLLRRGLGLGPGLRPPCIVHLHSPTEFIVRHNDWQPGSPDLRTAGRLEEYCVRSADALLTPSRYLAAQVMERYQIEADRITVIPYPGGRFPWIHRDPSVWRSGRIVFVGRLEPRKGLIELVDAAIQVAGSHPHAAFDLIGEDLWYRDGLTMRRYLERRIPAALKGRFRFHGARPRAQLLGFLGQARAAVVPSRWENLPNSCIEAMQSGLPVIASPEGGMKELLVDGETGWIAASAAASDLAAALDRALGTDPERCAAMGRAAAEAVRRSCGNSVVLARQLSWRQQLIRGATARNSAASGLGQLGAAPSPARVPGQIAIVIDAWPGNGTGRTVHALHRHQLVPGPISLVERNGHDASAESLDRAIRNLLGQDCEAIAIVSSGWELDPAFLPACRIAFGQDSRLGLLTGWMGGRGNRAVRPHPAFPYQWLANDAAGLAVFRADAIRQVGGLRASLPRDYALWDLCNAVLESGWSAMTYPAVLARRPKPPPALEKQAAPGTELLRERLPQAFARDSEVLERLQREPERPIRLRLRDVARMPAGSQLALALDALRRPRVAFGWLRTRWERRP